MSDNIRYVPLQALFPRTHRVTLYRWRRDGKIPPPDRVINGRAFYAEDRFATDDDAERDANLKKA